MKRAGSSPLVWDIAIPLATNPLMLRQYAWGCGLTGLIMALLLGGLAAAQGEWDAVAALVGLAAACAGGLFVLMVLVSLVVLGNRLKVRYTVDDRRVGLVMTDRVGRGAARAAAVLGAAGGNPAVTGTGLIAMADEERGTAWSAVAGATFHPARRVIRLRNSWRTVLEIYCTEDTWPPVKARVEAALAAAPRRRRPGLRANPLPALLGWSLAMVVAVAPLFALPWPFELHLLPLIALVVFAEATVWLLPLLAWGMLAAEAAILAQVVAIGLHQYQGLLGAPYTGFASLRGDEWAGMAVAAAGLGFLAWFAIRCLRGRGPSALALDMDEMAGD